METSRKLSWIPNTVLGTGAFSKYIMTYYNRKGSK